MTMLASEPAICKNCGNEQLYTKVISWNMWLNPEYPANNICHKCGAQINYDDIDLSTCSPNHREEIRWNKIYERMKEIQKNSGEEDIVCPKCGSSKISFGFYTLELPEKYKNEKDYRAEKSYYDCSECGQKTYQTIEDILSSGFYEFVENGQNEHEYIVKKSDNYDELMDEAEVQMRAERDRAESELILEGVITTKEEEKEYSDKYYKFNIVYPLDY
jgi:DNA-directed RNA polymerase subunit RPC12/RpoP